MDLSAVWAQWTQTQIEPEDAERQRLLDAARVEFIAHGFRRAAVADIARRAKVSRQTLNRRCGDKDDMVSAVLTREVLEFFARLTQTFETQMPVEDQVVELFVIGIRECRTNPLVAALREHESESISTGLLAADNDNSQLIVTLLSLRLMADGYPPEGAAQAADLLVRVTATLLLAPSKALRTETDDQSRELAKRYFIPILNAARTGS